MPAQYSSLLLLFIFQSLPSSYIALRVSTPTGIQRTVTEPVEVQKPVMPFALSSSVVTAAISVL
jgi:hypothetical protein